MFIRNRELLFASTGADFVNSVMASPLEGNQIIKSEHLSSTSNSDLVQEFLNKRLSHRIDGPLAEQSGPKRHLTAHTQISESDVSIFDSDGLISLPDRTTAPAIAPENLKQSSPAFPDMMEKEIPHTFTHTSENPIDLGTISAQLSPSAPPTSIEPATSTSPEYYEPVDHPDHLTHLVNSMIENLSAICRMVTPQPEKSQGLFEELSNANAIVQNVLSNISGTGTSTSHVVETPQPSHISLSLAPPPLVPAPVPVQPPVRDQTIGIALVQSLETLWYADRPYPQFDCQVLDAETNQPVNVPQPCHIRISLLDGEDAVVDKLGGQAAMFDFEFPVVKSTASIHSLRFLAVSSKHGGHFRLRFDLVLDKPGFQLQPFISDKIQILSYRLFHSRKLDFAKLKRTDSISKVKGIGNLYAKRFAEMGIETVKQLAELDVDNKHLIEGLRKDRGALTIAKLKEYIAQAKEIVNRDDSLSE